MDHQEPIAESLPSNLDHATVIPWSEACKRLAEAESFWLATVRPVGRPHVMPLLTVWLDGALYFCAGTTTRKAKNLARNSHCVLTTTSRSLPALDLVVEGHAAKVSNEATLQRVAGAYGWKYGWPVTVRDGAFYGDGAPTAGPPPYEVYALSPTVAFGFPGVTAPDDTGQDNQASFSPTRWRFSVRHR